MNTISLIKLINNNFDDKKYYNLIIKLLKSNHPLTNEFYQVIYNYYNLFKNNKELQDQLYIYLLKQLYINPELSEQAFNLLPSSLYPKDELIVEKLKIFLKSDQKKEFFSLIKQNLSYINKKIILELINTMLQGKVPLEGFEPSSTS